MSSNTKAYYEYRADKERILAAGAVSPRIAAIHLEMAARYQLLAISERSENPHWSALQEFETPEQTRA